MIADGFPLLNALKEVHLLLAEGAHNQFGDLPWTARVEMLIQQWLLARPEMREFLQGRAHGALHRSRGWTAGRHHEDAAGLDGRHRSRTSATSASSASRSCCRSATATGATINERERPRTGRATGGRRSRATSTPTAR